MSKGAERVLKALKLMGNHLILLEHVVGDRLRLDFYLKHLKLGIEVDGIQHDRFNSLYHDSAEAFKAAQQRDRRKEELCEQLGITLVRLKYDEVMHSKSAEELLQLIYERTEEARSKTRVEEEDQW